VETARIVDTHLSGMDTDDVTVVVVTRNRRRRLDETLCSLRHLPERRPVMVVGNDSRDGTAEEAARVGATVIRAPSNAARRSCARIWHGRPTSTDSDRAQRDT
jgi:hypothetical protein